MSTEATCADLGSRTRRERAKPVQRSLRKLVEGGNGMVKRGRRVKTSLFPQAQSRLQTCFFYLNFAFFYKEGYGTIFGTGSLLLS